MLHITNGESANLRLKGLEIPGEFMGWDDPLHHGPVPAGLSMREMSEIRAGHIADRGWADLEKSRLRFRERDLKLQDAARNDEVVIWSSFELFDQLHLLQLLNWFEQNLAVIKPPSVVWVRDYLGAAEDDDDLRILFFDRETVTEPQLGSAAAIWQAFSAPDPSSLVAWMGRGLGELPLMQRALHRLLEEYPSINNGLSRTQQQVLLVLEPGPLGGGEIFRTSQALEQRRFMGDYSFWVEMGFLLNAEQPAVKGMDGKVPRFPPVVEPNSVEFRHQLLTLTEHGQQLLEYQAIHQPRDDRWIGGGRIEPDCRWCWDPNQQTLVQRDSA